MERGFFLIHNSQFKIIYFAFNENARGGVGRRDF